MVLWPLWQDHKLKKITSDFYQKVQKVGKSAVYNKHPKAVSASGSFAP